jgi:hypothetical protein
LLPSAGPDLAITTFHLREGRLAARPSQRLGELVSVGSAPLFVRAALRPGRESAGRLECVLVRSHHSSNVHLVLVLPLPLPLFLSLLILLLFLRLTSTPETRNLNAWIHALDGPPGSKVKSKVRPAELTITYSSITPFGDLPNVLKRDYKAPVKTKDVTVTFDPQGDHQRSPKSYRDRVTITPSICG